MGAGHTVVICLKMHRTVYLTAGSDPLKSDASAICTDLLEGLLFVDGGPQNIFNTVTDIKIYDIPAKFVIVVNICITLFHHFY